jgi:antitoxin HicB
MSPSEFKLIVERIPDEYGGGFVASVAELPDCMAHGATAKEAADRLSKAIGAWKIRATQAGREIPRPLAKSGKQHQTAPVAVGSSTDRPRGEPQIGSPAPRR